MSVDFPIDLIVKAEGAEAAKYQMDALFEVMRKGTNVSTQTTQAAKDLRKELVTKTRAISTMDYAFRASHPTMMIFSRAISAIGSATRQALGLFDSYNILLLTMQGKTNEVRNADIDVEKKQRAYNDAVKQFGPDSQPALDAFADLQQALNDQKTATDDAKEAKVRYATQMGLLGISAATLISNLGPLWNKISDLKIGTMLLGDKFTWLTGLLGAPIIFAGILVAGVALSAYLYSQGESFDSLDKKASDLFKDFDKTVSARLKDFEKSMDDFTNAILEGNIQKLAETAPIQILAIFGRISILVLAAIGRLAIGILEALGKLTISMLAIFGKFAIDSLAGIGKWVVDMLVSIGKFAWDCLVALGKWIVDSVAAVAKFGSEIWDSINKGLSDVSKKIYDFGVNLVKNLANGIRDSIKFVTEAASNVASTITDYLGIHSPAKAGPLSNLMEWGPNLVSTYATGMDTKLPQLQSSVNNVARTLSIGSLSVSVNGGNGNASGRDISRSIILELNRYMRWA